MLAPKLGGPETLTMVRILIALALCALTTSCLAGAAVGAAGKVVGGAVSVTGDVLEAGVDVVTSDDDEGEGEED